MQENGSENNPNSAGNSVQFVPFGPHHTDIMPVEWAVNMLTGLKARNPKLFGELLQAAAGVETKRRGERA